MKACVKCGKEYDDAQLVHCPDDDTTLVKIDSDLAPGTILGDRYEIIAVIADGGMGKVYKAKHRLIDKTVAIKTILPNMIMSGAVLKRFQQEADAISKLNHPNILGVTDFFVSSDAHPYLVTNFLEGQSLQRVIDANGPLPEARALHIFKQICAGLKHAHLHKIIHRDLKPANVMIINQDDQNDFVKIIDFGIAKVISVSQQNSVLTETGDVFGSPPYMSPEQCRGKPLDARSDIYSLGCILFAMLAGRPPFTGGDDVEYMFKHVHEAPPALPESTSLPIASAVAKMLQKEPADRFQTISDILTALELPVTVQTTAIADIEPQSQKIEIPKPALAIVVAGILAALAMFVPHKSSHPSAITPVTPVQTVSQTSVQPTPPPAANTVAPTTSTVKPAAATPAVPAEAPLTPAQQYQQSLQKGIQAFNVSDFGTAQREFKAAHDAAFTFGERDPRFVDSLEWQAKNAAKQGNYVGAMQGFRYVIRMRKASGNRQALAAAEKELRAAQSQLHSLNAN